MRNVLIVFMSLLLFVKISHAQFVTDVDGNEYDTVTIGSQVWMKENLNVTHYNNGDTIPYVQNNTVWAGLSTGAYCNYENDTSFAAIYGRLYNWYAVSGTKNICPTGWHVATDSEWTILTDLLGGEAVAGGKLKETGTLYWSSPNFGATNEVGFTALPGGYRSNTEVYLGFGGIGSWWCSTESSATDGWARGIFNDAVNVDRGGYYEKKMGFSVRCVKNSTSEVNSDLFNDHIKIYPNPATDRVFIDCSMNQNLNIFIYNVVKGELVMQKQLTQGTAEIDVSFLSNGVYIIQIVSESDVRQLKLIINNSNR